MDPAYAHQPVLVDRTVELLRPVPDGTLVDLTVGGAGHAAALLDAHPGLSLVGIDQDPDALVAAATNLARFGDRVVLRHSRSDDLTDVLAELGVTDVSAALADLGVSSFQLDAPTRGFSYRADHDGPLDMRMDRTRGRSAAILVNEAEPRELVGLLRDLGDERSARRVVDAIVAARPITGTARLADVVRGAIPAAARRRGGDPAKRTFQALRIAVNDELGVLTRTLDQVIDALVPGGRLVVIAYHSGEDRIVKARLRRADDGGCSCPPGLPCVCGATPVARLLRRGGWTPAADEIAANRRAESARLRAIEKLPVPRTEP